MVDERKRMKTVSLSGRMQMLADMVTAGNRVADVGCDHAFLPIYLVQTGKCPNCLAMDVRKGPLTGAGEHIAFYEMGEYIETRLSDGLSAYHIGEAQTLVCAGMGGRLMERILREGGEKARSFSELILQPQSEICEFRRFLRNAGFHVTAEAAVYEDDKYYFAMKAVPREQGMSQGWSEAEQQGKPAGLSERTGRESSDGQKSSEEELYDLYGKRLLLDQHPVLKQYLLHRMAAVGEIIARLRQKDTAKSEARQRELCLEKERLEQALNYFEKGR